MELKTLKDFEHKGELYPRQMIEETNQKGFVNAIKFIENRQLERIKTEAVKWIKEDFEWMDKRKQSKETLFALRNLELSWIERFNITEELLK